MKSKNSKLSANMKIFLATNNPSKKEVLKRSLDGFGFEFFSPTEIDKKIDVVEDGKNFKENAEKKALTWSTLTGEMTIASDGGVDIPVLGENWNQMLTHRFAGQEATDQDRVKALLEIMKQYKDEDRRVYWSEAVALAKQSHLIKSWQASGEKGYLADDYDPAKIKEGWWTASLWYHPEFKKVHIDLTDEEREQETGCWRKLTDELQNFFRQYVAERQNELRFK